MESQPKENMKSTERKLLLIEYTKIVVKEMEKKAPLSDVDLARMNEIEVTLNLNRENVLTEAIEYISSSVT